MLRRKIYVKFNRRAHKLYSLLLLMMIFLFNGCSATHKGDLRFNETPSGETFNLSGQITLNEIIETDSARTSLTTIKDFSSFTVTAGNVTTHADKYGYYSLNGVAFSDSLVLKAVSNKIALLKRVTVDDLCYSDLNALPINLETTSEALVYQQGLLIKKDLTPADIRAREYKDGIASITTAIRLAMQLPKASIPTTVLELPAITSAAKNVAYSVIARESTLKDTNAVLRHAFLRKDLDIIKVYLSPSFGNDWDSSSNWNDAISYIENIFKENEFTNLSWEILDTELLPDSRARIRTRVTAIVQNINSEEIIVNKTWTFDAMWREEGSVWKLYRNMPYKEHHPTEADVDNRWGEIAAAHAELQSAINSENIEVLKTHISESFRNDFDGTSTKNDLILTAMQRFNSMDVKVSEYSIDSIRFTSDISAEVTCSGRVKVIKLIPGIDVDSGTIQAKITWRKEDGIWKISNNLPYRFSHRLTLDSY